MKGRFDAYVLRPLTYMFQKRIVSAETIRGNTVVKENSQSSYPSEPFRIIHFTMRRTPCTTPQLLPA